MKKIFDHVQEDVGGKMLCNGLIAWKPTETTTRTIRCSNGSEVDALIGLLIESGYEGGKFMWNGLSLVECVSAGNDVVGTR